ncbi:MAG TPA: M1 family metallopeptidase [Rhizomicrobium sp.]
MFATQKLGHAGLALLLGAVLCLSGCGKPAEKSGPHRPGISLGGEAVPLGRLPRVAIPERYRIALRIDPRADRFTGHVEIDVEFAKPRRALFLHGLGLSVSGVSVRLKSGQTFAAHYDQVDPSGVARLIFVDRVPAGEATLIFDYDAPYNRSLQGLYKVAGRGDSYAFTQFESADARRAFPSFDEPGFKTPFDITVIVPRGMKVVGNTPIVAAAPAAHGMVDTVLETTRPLPTYLVALAVGPLDVVDAGWVPPNKYRARPLHIRGIAARGEGGRMGYALSLTPRIVAALESYFGIGFPFRKLDILAVPDFAAGAMENAGAITFRERFVLLDRDASLDQKRASLSVQAHEISHQWFGDLVTPAWWDDVWLNESFADWMENKAAAAVLPEMEFDSDTLRGGIDAMGSDELPSAHAIHSPIADLDDLDTAFDDITYDKGAAVLRMFETYVGPDDWQRGIHAYLVKFAGGNATAHDFIATIALTTGHAEIVPAFGNFIDQPGVPFLRIARSCAPPGLNLAQSAYAPFGFAPPPRRWSVPVCAMDGTSRVCRMSGAAAFTLPLATPCPALPLPNANGGGYYRFGLDAAGWKQEIAGAAKLDSAGQITLLANVFAGLRAGRARPADLFDLVRAIAPTARWDVLDSLARQLPLLRQSLAPADLPAYGTVLAADFLPRFKAVGVKAKRAETPSDAFLRRALATLLVTEAHNAAATAMLAGPILSSAQPGAGKWQDLAYEVRNQALRATLRSDPGFAETLLGIYRSTDAEALRRDIVYAFAGSDDPAVVGKLLALVPSQMRIGELFFLLQFMADEPVARRTLWTYVGAHYDEFAKRLSPQGTGPLAEILRGACDASSRADADAFLHKYIGQALGAAKRTQQTQEHIRRCMALRQNAGPAISAALAAAAR